MVIFAPVDYTFSNGEWHVEMFYADQWLFNRDNLAQRFNFFATNTQSGPGQLVDGITQIDNVSWILSDPFPTALPEPSTISLAAFGFVGLMAWNWRRRKREAVNLAKHARLN